VKTTEVRLGSRSYPIFVGEGILARLADLLTRLGFSSAPVVVSNPRVFKLHGDSLRRSLEPAYGPAPVVFMGDGERF
jgi:3-dehydroquinate synthase